MKDLKLVACFCVITAFLFGLGFLLYYSLDDALDFNILHNQIINNQTFVDEMPCSKIIQTRNTLPYIHSPKQQEVVEQLKIDFDRLYEEKGCK